MLSRRAFLVAVAASGLSCRRATTTAPEAPSASAPPILAPAPASAPAIDPPVASSAAQVPQVLPADLSIRSIAFGPSQGGPQQAVLVTPAWGSPGDRYPLLIALGGLGETRRGINAGAWGWVKDYWLDRAMKRLRAPPLVSADFQEFVTPERLAAINASLIARPFRGLVVACPFTPDLITPKSLDNAGPFARFLADHLLSRVRAETPALADRAATGVDGVSLGGRLSLLAMLERPEAFGVVGSMQGAFEDDEIDELAARIAKRKPAGSRLRVLTSESDFYKDALQRLHAVLEQAHVAHDYLLLPGTHEYRFNRGPGSLEMLLFHDRALRGEEP
jgi:iron(III)-salmochelin esterase